MSRKVCLDKKITKPAHKALSISILMCCVNAQLGEHEEQFIFGSILPEICGRYTNWSAKIPTGNDNKKKYNTVYGYPMRTMI